MSNVAQVSQAMHRVLTEAPEPAAAETGLVRRRSKLTGPILAPTLVFGWLSDPAASLAALTQQSAALGAPVSPQGLFQRFGPQGAECLRRARQAAVAEVIAAAPVAVPSHPGAVQRGCIQDSSVIMLPDALGEVWAGCGGSNGYGQSALKLQRG